MAEIRFGRRDFRGSRHLFPRAACSKVVKKIRIFFLESRKNTLRKEYRIPGIQKKLRKKTWVWPAWNLEKAKKKPGKSFPGASRRKMALKIFRRSAPGEKYPKKIFPALRAGRISHGILTKLRKKPRDQDLARI